MSTEDTHFLLPSKVDTHLATLSKMYEKCGNSLLQEVVVNGVPTVQEEWTISNWRGESYGHAITLTLQESIFVDVIDQGDEVRRQICEDLNKLNHIQDEYVADVFLEMEVMEHTPWRERSGILRPHPTPAPVPSDALQRIWGSGHVRIFLSHTAIHREKTSELKTWLGKYGMACFVAHEDIQPTED